MSEAARVEHEYRSLVTKVLRDGLDGKMDAEETRRLTELSKARARVNTPDYEAMLAAAD